METNQAVASLSALAHEGRLEVIRLLVRAGPEGLAAGRIAQALGVPANTLSANLTVLAHAGLVQSQRQGRSVIYTAAYPQLTALIGFLMQDCCQGAPEVCAPVGALARQLQTPKG